MTKLLKNHLGGAHSDREKTFLAVSNAIVKSYEALKNLSPKDLVNKRMEKYLKWGYLKVNTFKTIYK